MLGRSGRGQCHMSSPGPDLLQHSPPSLLADVLQCRVSTRLREAGPPLIIHTLSDPRETPPTSEDGSVERNIKLNSMLKVKESKLKFKEKIFNIK